MNKFFLIIILIVTSNHFPQEEIYIPENIKILYKNGTRSLDGKPGKYYWQNSADYFIKAEFNPKTRILSGEEKIIYRNNSPHYLNEIVIHLFADLYRKGNKRDSGISEKDLTDGVNLHFLKFNGININLSLNTRRTETNIIINNLPSYVPPSGTCTLEIKWDFILPSVSPIRMGAYNDSTFFIAYWYPKVAVYDDVEGWNKKDYSGKTEFYSDYGNYDVEITLPSDYLVWATGELQNQNEVYTEYVLKKFNEAKNSDKVVNIITSEDYSEKNKLFKNNKENTWKFFAENIPDFSFASAKNYNWDGTGLIINEKRIFIDAAYPNHAPFYDEAAEFSKISIEYFSKNFPGIPYPFPKFTSFCNGRLAYGGMETPMMANNNAPDERGKLLSLISHEIFHSYFPFYVGVNEIKYAWMEEGWASYLPSELFPEYDSTFNQFTDRKNKYFTAGTEYDLPPIIPSHLLSSRSLYTASYIRSLFAYHSLRKYLGEELFKKSLINYVNNWKYKHPIPYDFFFSFNKSAGEDLSWFWNPWFFGFAFVDIGLEKTDDNNINVKQIGKIPVHVLIRLKYNDGSEEILELGVKYWKNNSFYEINIKRKDIISAELITDEIPDINPDNNVIFF